MTLEKSTYALFYVTGVLTLLVVSFTEGLAIYVKPLVIVALGLLYVVNAKYKNYLVLLSLVLALICETLFFQDYVGNFVVLHILLSMYYALNVILLWKSLQLIKIRFKKIFTGQLIVLMILVAYVLYSVAELIMPQISDHSIALIVLIVFFTLFIWVCYYIYLNSRMVISYSLMIAASCFLLVNIIVALDRLYVSVEVFSIITTFLQITGQFFLIKFFMEQHELKPNEEEYF